MKRKLTLFLTAAMAASCLPMTAYAADFADINAVPWAKNIINTAADRGLISGYEEGGKRYFKAKNNVTYCEAMHMAYTALNKAGALLPLSAETTYGYMTRLSAYQVPIWAQPAVAWGLENSLIGWDMVATKFMGGNQAATREDVARIFGAMMGRRYDYQKINYAAAEFKDYWKISDLALYQVDLLKRLGIMTGDDKGNFNPQNNINRAEMAVILNKTYEILTEGIGGTGTIENVTNNEGEYFYIEVKLDNGTTQGFHAMAGNVTVYNNAGQESALSRLSKGDRISVKQNGGALSEVHILSAIPSQEKYDQTGFITSMKDSIISFENENTGEEMDYTIDKNCICYLEGVKTTGKTIEAAIRDADENRHAFAGLITETRAEDVKNSQGIRERVYNVYVTELHVFFQDEYTTAGKVEDFTSTAVTFRPSGTTARQNFTFASSCEFYIADKKTTKAAAKELAESGTTYVKVTVNEDDYATKVIISEDSFEAGKDSTVEEKIIEVLSLTEVKMRVEIGKEEVTYKFGSENPLDNIVFYRWNTDDKEWDDIDVKAAEKFVDDCEDAGKKVYGNLEFNKGGKIVSVDLSTVKNAWKGDVDEYTERKGTVTSVKNGILNFKTSAVDYKMLNNYNLSLGSGDNEWIVGPNADGADVRYPLVISSAATSSLKVFEKLANDPSVKLYAEILADGDDKVVKIDARLTEAKGKLVDYDILEDVIIIETSAGNELRLKTNGILDLTDEDEDIGFTIESLATPGYEGSSVELIFSDEGPATEVTVTESTYSDGVLRIEGIATGAYDGLKVEGESKTYRWQSRSYLDINNLSSSSTDPEKLKDMIEDKDVEVYVKATISDHEDDARKKVEKITVYVKSAVGTIVQFNEEDGILLLKTKAGNTFPLYVENGADCDLNGLEYDDLKNHGKGLRVGLTFNDRGAAKLIEEL